MSDLIFALIALPILTSGRRLYALRHSLTAAQSTGKEIIISLLESAIEHDTETVLMERAWVRSRNVSKARGQAFYLDKKIDSVLSNMHSVLNSNIKALAEDDPVSLASQLIIEQIYPEGIAAIISLPFEEQLIVNETIIKRFDTDLKESATTAEIDRFVKRLVSLNTQFATELENAHPQEISYKALEAARAKGNVNLRTAVAATLVEYRNESADATNDGHRILKPILDQCERVRQAHQNYQPVDEVDPDTGEEVPELSSDTVE